MSASVDTAALGDLVAGLRKRSADCRDLMVGRDEPAVSRLLGKSQAYAEATRLVKGRLADKDGLRQLASLFTVHSDAFGECETPRDAGEAEAYAHAAELLKAVLAVGQP